MTNILVFDMDGTIVDLYGVENWLSDLRSENERPYVEANPIYNTIELNQVLMALKNNGWKIVITSWLSKGSTKEYDNKVRKAKKEWLDITFHMMKCILSSTALRKLIAQENMDTVRF